MGNLNATFALYLLIIVIGYFVKRLGIIKESDGRTLVNLVLYITFPAVVIKTFNSVSITPLLGMVFLISIGYGVFMSLIALLIYRRRGVDNQKGLMITSSLGFNIGLFAYPFVLAIWGYSGLVYVAVFDLGNAFIVYGVSYIIAAMFTPNKSITISAKNVIKRLILFVPLQCYVIAMILDVAHIRFTGIGMTFLTTLANANSPIVLIILGVYLNFNLNRSHIIDVIKILFLRYGVGIIVGVVLFHILPFALLPRTAILLGLVMPIGMIVIPHSLFFDYDSKLAGFAVNLSNIISFILIWIVMLSIKI